MPSVFVPGPSVRPNFGSPSTYLNLLQKTIQGFGDRRIASEKVTADKLFRDQTLAQSDRKQDFVEGADARTELKRVNELARDNEKTNTVQGMAEGLQFAGGDRFTGFESILSQDPTYAGLDDAGKLAARNKFINNNPSALTPPKQFGEQLAQQLAGSGLFTGAEIKQQVSDQIKQRYPTADPSIIKSLLAKPDFKISNSGTGTSSSRRGGSVSLLSGQTNQPNKDEQVNAEFESLGLTDKRTKETFGVQHDDINIPIVGSLFGKRNVTQQNYNKALSALERDGHSVSSSIAALRSVIDGNLETDINLDKLTGDQLKALGSLAEQNEAQQTQIFNKRGGGISDAGQSSTGSPADIVNQVEQFNQKLLSRLTPSADSDAQVVKSFLASLGGASHGIKSRGGLQTLPGKAGDNQGAEILTPKVAPGGPPAVDEAVKADQIGLLQQQIAQQQANNSTPEPSGSAGLDQLIANNKEAEFPNIGVPQGAEKIFNNVSEFVQKGNPVPAVKKLFESLTPPGPGVLDPRSQPEPTAREQAASRQTEVDNLSPSQRSNALREARKLSKSGTISVADADGEGGSADEALIIAYIKYLEGQPG